MTEIYLFRSIEDIVKVSSNSGEKVKVKNPSPKDHHHIKALIDKLLKMFKSLKMKIFNGFNFLICLIIKFYEALN